jgi:hypothetical protein
MAAHVSVVDSDDSSDSHSSILVIDAAESSSSSSSSSSDPNIAKDWNIKYRKLPKKRSLALRFMTWTAGRPRNAEFMKKKYRDEDVDSELFRVSTTTLIGSMLGKWPTETRMYWVTMGENEEGGGDGGGGETSGDDDEKKEEKRRMFVMTGGSGSGRSGRAPVYVQDAGIPPPIPQMDPRFPTTAIPRFPPGMGGLAPPT